MSSGTHLGSLIDSESTWLAPRDGLGKTNVRSRDNISLLSECTSSWDHCCAGLLELWLADGPKRLKEECQEFQWTDLFTISSTWTHQLMPRRDSEDSTSPLSSQVVFFSLMQLLIEESAEMNGTQDQISRFSLLWFPEKTWTSLREQLMNQSISLTEIRLGQMTRRTEPGTDFSSLLMPITLWTETHMLKPTRTTCTTLTRTTTPPLALTISDTISTSDHVESVSHVKATVVVFI